MGKVALKSGLNSILDDTAEREITRLTIRAYGGDDWNVINAALADWQSKGFVKILKLPEFAKDGEECVELLNYIEHASPWPKQWGK
jgi:hypothetical protein